MLVFLKKAIINKYIILFIVTEFDIMHFNNIVNNADNNN